MAFDRQLVDAGELHDPAGRAGHRHRHLPGADFAAGSGHADDPVAVAQETGDLAILDDVDAAPVRAARITPGDSVVARGAGLGCSSPPTTGNRAEPETSSPGTMRAISSGFSQAASPPL